MKTTNEWKMPPLSMAERAMQDHIEQVQEMIGRNLALPEKYFVSYNPRMSTREELDVMRREWWKSQNSITPKPPPKKKTGKGGGR